MDQNFKKSVKKMIDSDHQNKRFMCFRPYLYKKTQRILTVTIKIRCVY